MRNLPSVRCDPKLTQHRNGTLVWRSYRSDVMPVMRLGVLALALCALALYGCSASASRGDTQNGSGSKAANLSPEQCLNGAAIQTAADQQNYHIQPGDQLAINFYLNPEFNDEVPVSPDGKITLRLIGTIPAAGVTPSQLASQIDKDYLSELRSPGATVIVKNMPGRQVYVQGEVTRPGAFPLQPGMTAMQAIADAGGTTQDAADNSVVLIRRDACGRPTGERLDLASAVSDPSKGDDAALMPYDVLVVPRSRIANMDLFVQHYIRNLMPIEPYLAFPGPPL